MRRIRREGLRENPHVILVERDDPLDVRGWQDFGDVPDDMPSRNHFRSVPIT
jgi:hypothetical protein